MAVPDTVPEFALTGSMAPSPAPPSLTVRSFGLTDRGRVRAVNEDQFVILDLARTLHVRQTSVSQAKNQYGSHRGQVFVVADGMGGHQAGETASAISVLTVEGFLLNTLKKFFHEQRSEEHSVMQEFRSALLEADARIFEEANQHPEMIGMGTTLTMAFAVNRRLLVAHAGDSRCYLLSGGKLQRLTQDHTLVAEMLKYGAVSPEEASRHPYRHVITNALGGNKQGVQVDMHRLDLEAGDVVMLCSDGLSEMVLDERIAAILFEEQEPQQACERLVTAANERGGTDNITVIVARFE